MSKFDEFHALRKELSTEYEKELSVVQHVLEHGVHIIGGQKDFVSVLDNGNFVAKG